MTTAAKKAKPKQKKPSHAPFAFVRETPCEVCGSEWFSPGMRILGNGEMEEVTMCANIWHDMIAKLRERNAALTTERDNTRSVAERAFKHLDALVALGSPALPRDVHNIALALDALRDALVGKVPT